MTRNETAPHWQDLFERLLGELEHRSNPDWQADQASLEAEPELTLGDYLASHGYGAAFVEDHLLPMASAIWSGPADELRTISAAAFVRWLLE